MEYLPLIYVPRGEYKKLNRFVFLLVTARRFGEAAVDWAADKVELVSVPNVWVSVEITKPSFPTGGIWLTAHQKLG